MQLNAIIKEADPKVAIMFIFGGHLFYYQLSLYKFALGESAGGVFEKNSFSCLITTEFATIEFFSLSKYPSTTMKAPSVNKLGTTPSYCMDIFAPLLPSISQ